MEPPPATALVASLQQKTAAIRERIASMADSSDEDDDEDNSPRPSQDPEEEKIDEVEVIPPSVAAAEAAAADSTPEMKQVATASMSDADMSRSEILGISTDKITVAVLRAFCIKNDVRQDSGKAVGKIQKRAVIHCIRMKKNRIDRGEADPWLTNKNKNDKDVKLPVNKFRLANVVFGEICRPDMATRGRCLNKDELTEGKKTDEDLYKLVATEYNGEGVGTEDEYGINVYASAIDIDASNHPSVFDKITWTEAQRYTKEALKAVDVTRANHFVSGTHEELGKIIIDKPICDFTTQQYILYWHHHAVTHETLFEKLKAGLPDDVFFSSAQKTKEQLRGRKPSASSEAASAFNKLTSIEEKKLLESKKHTEAVRERNNIIEEGLLREHISKCMHDRNEFASKRRKLMDEMTMAITLKKGDGQEDEQSGHESKRNRLIERSRRFKTYLESFAETAPGFHVEIPLSQESTREYCAELRNLTTDLHFCNQSLESARKAEDARRQLQFQPADSGDDNVTSASNSVDSTPGSATLGRN